MAERMVVTRIKASDVVPGDLVILGSPVPRRVTGITEEIPAFGDSMMPVLNLEGEWRRFGSQQEILRVEEGSDGD